MTLREIKGRALLLGSAVTDFAFLLNTLKCAEVTSPPAAGLKWRALLEDRTTGHPSQTCLWGNAQFLLIVSPVRSASLDCIHLRLGSAVQRH